MPTTLHLFLLGFGIGLAESKSLRSSVPATFGPGNTDDWILKTGYPIGNGRIGAIPFGEPKSEKAVLNIDSLWSGGPYEAENYTGGNPKVEKYSALAKIRQFIFKNGTGDVSPLLGSNENYGSYRVLGNLSVSLDGVNNYDSYGRTLDLTTGVHKTTFSSNGTDFTDTFFCSYPDQVCVYGISSSNPLPRINVWIENSLMSESPANVSCGDDYSRLTGYTQTGRPLGMKFDAIARIPVHPGETYCSDDGKLIINPDKGQSSIFIVVGAGTNFDQSKGNLQNNYSFEGEDPSSQVEKVTKTAAGKTFKALLYSHVPDYSELQGAFDLILPDPEGSANKETSTLIAEYKTKGVGDPYLEAVLFDLSRHLLISSSRENSLPANLQGRWSEGLTTAWSGDYHANINLQMNYWGADQTGLGRTQDALWNYMERNWVPRGSETARLLYNGSGWVVHDELNIFGHTGMKNSATWANYPAAAAWMIQHVWNKFDYTQNVTWLKEQGYPLIKGVAEFWLSQLQEDAFFEDGSLVVNPCNSPEHGPTTFGCAHYQQEIHHVFEAVFSSAPLVSEMDSAFLSSIEFSLSKLDRGLHLTAWGGLKEWKLPDSYGYDEKSTHRHLSHLTGWYPGYSISSFENGYVNSTIQDAVKETLISRGNGTADDADAGWAKVWRAACWARLNDTERAYNQLRYAISVNFAANGLSMYSATNAPLQIDANFGLAGAILSMLVVDLPLRHARVGEVRTVVLGPAIPDRWKGGSVKGLKIRGGGSVDFSWDDSGLVTNANLSGSRTRVRLVNVRQDLLAEA
ncbi:glycoside hydrolase family 95 protein-like protein [Whalleya microplaca]|nr:glycoside hydrolase family 95 protein-like protein [Whalleya microplaca]